MKRIAIVLAMVGALVAPLAAAAPGSVHPALRVLDKAPLALQGTGFVPAERLRVTVVTAQAQLVRRTRASGVGRFVVRFEADVDACYGARKATAVGMRGSTASIVLERPWQRHCVEPSGAP